jgi:hypothetical protein
MNAKAGAAAAELHAPVAAVRDHAAEDANSNTTTHQTGGRAE